MAMVSSARAYGSLLGPAPFLASVPSLSRAWELGALLGSWVVAGSILYRQPFAEPYDMFPPLLGRQMDLLIVSSRDSRLGVLGEAAARAGLSAAANVAVYVALRSPLWSLGAALLARLLQNYLFTG